ncbi:Methyltransferase-like protein 22 [Gryganskiella cystojenkinii]|nr:Methyltransferase-like protein 22 [Gryganskiella cystojenkinii]
MADSPPNKKPRLNHSYQPNSDTDLNKVKEKIINNSSNNHQENNEQHNSNNPPTIETSHNNEYNDDMVLSEVHVDPQNGSADGRLLTTIFHLSLTARTQSQKRAIVVEEDESIQETEDQSWDHAVEIQHAMGTTLRDVGAQVWMGSFLMIDWFMTLVPELESSVVLELGAGTGLASIACSLLASTCEKFFCTDYDTTVLLNCRQNIENNLGLQESINDSEDHAQSAGGNGQVLCRRLNWLLDNPLDPMEEEPDEFSWSQVDRDHWRSKGAFIIAADVVYDDFLTDALVTCLERLLQEPLPDDHPRHSIGRVAYVSMEKRYNFSLNQLAVVAHAYEYFIRKVGESSIIKADRIDTSSLGQHCDYYRSKDLELFRVCKI